MIVSGVLSKRLSVPLFDAEKVFNRYSKNGIPGFDMFIDYVHPSKDGNIVLCINAAEQIINIPQFNAKNNIVVNPSKILKSFQNGYSDENDINLQLKRFSLCCVTHQNKSVLFYGNWLLKNLPYESANVEEIERITKKIQAGVDAFKLKIDTDSIEYVNGIISNKQREMAKRKMDNFFNIYYPYGTY